MEIKELLFELSLRDSVGSLKEASNFAAEQLSKYMEIETSDNLTVIGKIKGESDYTLLLDAHIDQIAMVVTNIDDNGFLTVSNAGGIDIRALPSRAVLVHGKEKIPAVFCSTPPHLSSGEVEYNDISKIKLDTALGEKAKELISIGDFVTFKAEPRLLSGTKVSGRSFDNRAGVACVLEVAKRLKGKSLPVSVAFVLSDSEELGLRGIRPAAYSLAPDEAVVIDVSFGDGIGIESSDCGILGKGSMIGISPSLDSGISKKLISLAESKSIPYQTEVMGSTTSTNADMLSVSKEGVKTGLVSIPLRNMHTETEVIDLSDLNSVCDLLCEYILLGGVKND